MGNLSLTHMLIFFGIVLLLFGGRRLPELGGSMGRAIREFKDALDGRTPAETAARREVEAAKAAATEDKRA